MSGENAGSKNTLGKVLRIIGIVLFVLTVAFTLLGELGAPVQH